MGSRTWYEKGRKEQILFDGKGDQYVEEMDISTWIVVVCDGWNDGLYAPSQAE
tara:strand:+ start:3511 stop:3669 length:159 start_codon:yes stop_codon:yes gene_type:complete